jgi:GNAT superfamily N-acetyltransferase
MQIIRATEDSAAALTEIAFAAKRRWGYPESWLDGWRGVLTVGPDFIVTHPTYVAVLDERPVGFYALGLKGDRLELLHLWVLPEAMGQGVGRALFTHALEHTKELGFRTLEIESDPNAEGFYLRMGARRMGTNTREIDGERRDLPVLVYEIDCPA